MNTDKAYLFGLIIGGGDFGYNGEVLRILLPYKKWGSFIENPERAGRIADDILKKVSPMFRAIYNVSIQYETTVSGGSWVILCEGDISGIKRDIEYYGILCEGEIKKEADISRLIKDLSDNNMKRRFIAGLADTIGSMAPSHRRFTDEFQVISFEIKGYNFKFVCDLCHLLYSINCIPDQVNWNHPNIHSSCDPYYKYWKKGFKIRVLLDQYSQFGAFSFRTKSASLRENTMLQNNVHSATRCEIKDVRATVSTVHPAENADCIPGIIRGGHYIHHHHFCAVLGCEHAPYNKINALFNNLGDIVMPFPVLYKDLLCIIENRLSSDVLLSQRKYNIYKITLLRLKEIYDTNCNALLFGNSEQNGYPISEILKAAAYIIASEDELKGKRPKISYMKIIERNILHDPYVLIEIRIPDLLTPLVIVGNGRGALIGARNPEVYSRLIIHDPVNEYKIMVRKITEEDLINGRRT